ncbi:unnamed protein product [Parnassius mnemosyne]|uniref:ZAD domain-containing protein n=1 Tax=Parnassius mnemosyne TaxID=213953 RepID=A0AAV1L829_9NEOP
MTYFSEICRICLCDNLRMYVLKKTGLENLYKTLTNSFVDVDEEVIIVCFICHARLIRCRTLQQQAIESNAVLEQLLAGGSMVLYVWWYYPFHPLKPIKVPHRLLFARDFAKFATLGRLATAVYISLSCCQEDAAAQLLFLFPSVASRAVDILTPPLHGPRYYTCY